MGRTRRFPEPGPVQPGPALREPRNDVAWLEPCPDSLLPHQPDLEPAVQPRQGVRLAWIHARPVSELAVFVLPEQFAAWGRSRP